MIPVQFDYVAPATIEQAVGELSQRQGSAVLAGGQSLLTDLKARRTAPTTLVDLREISQLTEMGRTDSGALRVGAMVTLDQIATDKDIDSGWQCLSQAARSVADQQVRNRSTIGGCAAQNDQAGDIPAAALALAATINVMGPNGERSIPAAEFFVGANATALQTGEIIVSLDFPAPDAKTGSAYVKMAHPGSSYALCAAAASVRVAADGTVGACHIAITGAAGHASRLEKVEAALTGQRPTPDNIGSAANQINSEGLQFVSDLAASGEYRAHLAGVLVERALSQAVGNL